MGLELVSEGKSDGRSSAYPEQAEENEAYREVERPKGGQIPSPPLAPLPNG